jgi:hypothetical protein
MPWGFGLSGALKVGVEAGQCAAFSLAANIKHLNRKGQRGFVRSQSTASPRPGYCTSKNLLAPTFLSAISFPKLPTTSRNHTRRLAIGAELHRIFITPALRAAAGYLPNTVLADAHCSSEQFDLHRRYSRREKALRCQWRYP